MHDSAAYDGQYRVDALDFFVGDFSLIEEVLVEDHEVAKFTYFDLPFYVVFSIALAASDERSTRPT